MSFSFFFLFELKDGDVAPTGSCFGLIQVTDDWFAKLFYVLPPRLSCKCPARLFAYALKHLIKPSNPQPQNPKILHPKHYTLTP